MISALLIPDSFSNFSSYFQLNNQQEKNRYSSLMNHTKCLVSSWPASSFPMSLASLDVFSSIFMTWRTCAMTNSHDVNTCVIVLRPFDYFITDCQNMGWSGKSGTTFHFKNFLLWFSSCYGDCLIKQPWIWLRLVNLDAGFWYSSLHHQHCPRCHSMKTVGDFTSIL